MSGLDYNAALGRIINRGPTENAAAIFSLRQLIKEEARAVCYEYEVEMANRCVEPVRKAQNSHAALKKQVRETLVKLRRNFPEAYASTPVTALQDRMNKLQ